MANATTNATVCDPGWSSNDKFWTFAGSCHVPVGPLVCLQVVLLAFIQPMFFMSLRRWFAYSALLPGCNAGKKSTYTIFQQLAACYVGTGVAYVLYGATLLAGYPMYELQNVAPRLFLSVALPLVVTGISIVANGWFGSLPKQLFPAHHIVSAASAQQAAVCARVQSICGRIHISPMPPPSQVRWFRMDLAVKGTALCTSVGLTTTLMLPIAAPSAQDASTKAFFLIIAANVLLIVIILNVLGFNIINTVQSIATAESLRLSGSMKAVSAAGTAQPVNKYAKTIRKTKMLNAAVMILGTRARAAHK